MQASEQLKMRSEKQENIHVKSPLIQTDTSRKFLAKFANMKFIRICSSVLGSRGTTARLAAEVGWAAE